MNRVIKFRAWLTLGDYDDDGNDKNYYAMATNISVHNGGDIGFSTDEGYRIFGDDIFEKALDNGNAYEYEEWCNWEGRYELMQFTGLKDKSGKEIYEGDILEKYEWWDYKKNGELKKNAPKYSSRLVAEWGEFEDNCSGYEYESEPYLGWGILPSDAKERTVIGNIYENGDLL